MSTTRKVAPTPPRPSSCWTSRAFPTECMYLPTRPRSACSRRNTGFIPRRMWSLMGSVSAVTTSCLRYTVSSRAGSGRQCQHLPHGTAKRSIAFRTGLIDSLQVSIAEAAPQRHFRENKNMRRAYLDMEFTSLASHARLISLALVTSDGQELYLELLDNWKIDDCSGFVQDTVLPKLDLLAHGLTTTQARQRLRTFLETIAPVDILTASPHWDQPLLNWLLGPDGLPSSVCMRA